MIEERREAGTSTWWVPTVGGVDPVRPDTNLRQTASPGGALPL